MKILILLFFLVLFEYFYSLFKKDTVFYSKSLQINLLNQFCGTMKDILFPLLSVLGIITLLNKNIPHLFFLPENTYMLVGCLFFMDFLYYLFHRVSHAVKLFWMFHFVHHSDRYFNLSVGFRSSFFEILGLFSFYSVLLFFGVPIKIFLLSFSITSTYQFLTHSRYIKLPKILESFLVTPSYHLIHHDEDIKNQNSNFGGVFSIWDKIFHTYTKEIQSFTPGIKGYKQDNLIKIHTDPIFKYLKI